jgi:hypothetical protein
MVKAAFEVSYEVLPAESVALMRTLTCVDVIAGRVHP